jgi:hypothetical protein
LDIGDLVLPWWAERHVRREQLPASVPDQKCDSWSHQEMASFLHDGGFFGSMLAMLFSTEKKTMLRTP